MTALPIIQEEPININQELVWKTNNEYLIEVDSKRHVLNQHLGSLEDQLVDIIPSKTTGRAIKRTVDSIRFLTHQVIPENNFERILLDDILQNCLAADTYASFVFDKRPTKFTRSGKHFSVATFLRNFYGLVPKESPYNILLRQARQHNHKVIHEYFKQIKPMESSSRYVYLKDTLPKLEEIILPKIKTIMLDFAREMQMPQEKLDSFEVYFDQHGLGESFYDSSNNLSLIDPTTILLYKDDKGNPKIFEGSLITTGTHEKVHGLHSAFSNLSFPELIGLHSDQGAYNSSHMGLSEGIARRTERFSIPFYFNKHKEELGLTDKDLELMDLFSQYHLTRRHFQTIYTLFTVMQNTESIQGFDKHKKLAEVTGIPYFNRDHYLVDDVPLSGWMYFIGSILGSQYIKRCIKETNSRYGKEQIDQNLGLVLRGFMTGHWQLSTHYKFFNQEYIPKLESLGILKPLEST